MVSFLGSSLPFAEVPHHILAMNASTSCVRWFQKYQTEPQLEHFASVAYSLPESPTGESEKPSAKIAAFQGTFKMSRRNGAERRSPRGPLRTTQAQPAGWNFRADTGQRVS